MLSVGMIILENTLSCICNELRKFLSIEKIASKNMLLNENKLNSQK